MKLVNNFLCGVEAASFAEALRLVDAGGLDRAKAISIFTGGAPRSGILRRMAERETINDLTAVFALQWMAKDLSYAIDAVSDKGVPLPVATPRCLFLDRQWNQATEAKTSRRSSNRRRSKGKPEGATNSETRYDHPVAGNVIVVVELGKVSSKSSGQGCFSCLLISVRIEPDVVVRADGRVLGGRLCIWLEPMYTVWMYCHWNLPGVQ